MKPISLLALLLMLLLPMRSSGAPGAHGPNGEHLDGPSAAQAASVDGRPRMEGFSELFELVAHVENDRVSAMINAYKTNEPVDGASVELDSDGTTVKAEFDKVSGVYNFVDKNLANQLKQPGVHSLAFTIDTGEAFDIVAGSIEVAENAHHHESKAVLWTILAAFLLIAIALLFYLRRRVGALRAGVRS